MYTILSFSLSNTSDYTPITSDIRGTACFVDAKDMDKRACESTKQKEIF